MAETDETKVGKITHFYSKANVAVVEVIDGSIKVGDDIHIKGHNTDFRQKVTSMQIENENIELAEPGQSIGLKVTENVRDNDFVYKLI